MRFRALIILLLLSPMLSFAQSVSIGDILCTDGSTIRPEQFAASGRVAEGIVFYVDESGTHGWAVSLDTDALDTDWVTEIHYPDGYDIPDLPNCEYSRQALYDMNGYQNTAIIRATNGPDWYPAAWAVDFDNGWYLPAAGQMRWLLSYVNEINASLAVVGGSPFVLPYPDWHWTSTEYGSMHAVIVSRIGSVSNYMKWNYYATYTIGVRAIKDFECNSAPEHKIGDVITTPDGQSGIIFYVSPDDGSYWLTALNDLPESYSWGNDEDIPELDNIVDEMSQWYGMQGLYCGYDATYYMRNAQGSSNAFAAGHVDFENGWHIPSTGQLSKLYAALPHIEEALLESGGSLPSGDLYWTSTENSSDKAWAIDFGSNEHLYQEGRFVAMTKQTQCKVRPIWSQSCEIPLPEPTLPDNIIESDCNTPMESFGWGIREDWSSSDNIYCRINPLVGDLDDDGIPEIVCFDIQDNDPSQPLARTINVYDGRTKARKAQIHLADYVWAHGNGPYGLVKLPNRKSLIVTAGYDTKLYAYDITSANPSIPTWISDESYNTGNLDHSVSLGFADFNGDRHPEIYVRNKIFDAETGVLLATAQGGNNQANSYSHGSHTNHNKLSCPIAFDICGDTRQEMILGNEVYDVVITNRNGTSGNRVTLSKTVTPPNGIIADGHVQVADFNLDGYPDILVSNRNTDDYNGEVAFYVWDVHNERTSLPVQLNTNFIGKSIPLIADFDNDGFLEILIDCCDDRNSLLAYQFNPTSNSFDYLWSLPIDEDSYSNTATLFDFNNDGKNELVYTDNSNLMVFDLSTAPPTEISKIDCGEITIMQVPIVADIDNDGSAEIVVTGKAGGYMQASTMLKVFKSSTEPWRATRKVWNQYMYHVTNVNEDLTIPTFCFNTATVFTGHDGTIRRPYNNFLQQAGYITTEGEPYNPGSHVEVDIVGSGCNSYTFHSITYDESGHYEQLVETFDGCDTLYNIEVNLGQTIMHDFWKEECREYTWNDTTYTESGNYQQTFETIGGCDSIATLHLTITGTLYHEWAVVACDHYTWNDTTYTESGDHVQELLNPMGCDSIVTLHLTFSDAMEVDADSIACGSLWWGGQEYTESGLYDHLFVTPGGCDSLVHLQLTVEPYPEAIPEIEGLTEVFVATNLIYGKYYYHIDSVAYATHYEWEIEGADWPVDTTGLYCTLWVITPGVATLRARAWNGCGYTEQEIVIHAGFYDLEDQAAIPIALYPNPSSDKAFIVAEGIKRVKVYDMQGRLIKALDEGVTDKIELNLQDLPQSLYTVEVLTERGKARMKLSVMH